MKKTDVYRLSLIVEIGEQLAEVIKTEGITREDVLNSLHVQWLVSTPLTIIGEQAYAISKPYKAAHSQIPWSMIAGMRHRLVHDYEGTNWEFVADAALEEVPALIRQISEMLKEDDQSVEE